MRGWMYQVEWQGGFPVETFTGNKGPLPTLEQAVTAAIQTKYGRTVSVPTGYFWHADTDGAILEEKYLDLGLIEQERAAVASERAEDELNRALINDDM